MGREFTQPLYNSRQWKETRNAYMAQVNYICERCGNPAALVHHKKYVNEGNVRDPEITLNPDNLEALCSECHEQEHIRNRRRPTYSQFDEDGNPVSVQYCTVICGAPGSGKSTYAKSLIKWGDLLLDLDYINAALLGDMENIYRDHSPVLPVALQVRDTIYSCIVKHTGTWHHAYVITTQGNMFAVRELAQRLDASIHIMDTDKDECIRRVNNDIRRRNKTNKFERLIEKWFENYERTRHAIDEEPRG